MKQIEIEYLKADKTIENYLSFDGNLVFILNDQGLYFDVFFSKNKMNAFLENRIDRGDLFFDDEILINNYFGFN